MTTLFAFPTSGHAFTKVKSHHVDSDLGHPPPRKVARHDSTSSPNRQRASSTAGSQTITLDLNSPATPLERSLPALSSRLDRFIRTFLRTDRDVALDVSFHDVFLACRVVVLDANRGSAVAEVLERSVRSCAQSIMQELKSSELQGMPWLDAFNDKWLWWSLRLNVLCSTLVFLDTVYLSNHDTLKPIRQIGLHAFSEVVLGSMIVQSKTVVALRLWASSLRTKSANQEDKKRIALLVECATTVGRYEEHVEEPYVAFAAEHYAEESKTASGSTPRQYLKLCDERVEMESKAGDGILREETVRMAGVVALRKLVEPHIQMLTEDALGEIIEAQDKIGFKCLYDIILRVTKSAGTRWDTSPTDVLLARYRSEVLRLVNDIVADTTNDSTMVDRLLELKEFLDDCLSSDYVNDTEDNEKKYTHATSEAFTRGFESRKRKPAEMIAKHVDLLMRRGQKGASDAEFFSQMKRVLTLYRFTTDKDVFRKYYTNGLAKRLLLGRSASDDFEKEVIKVLSETYDAAFSDMTQLFGDLAISKDLVEDYRKLSVWPIIRKADKVSSGIELVLPSKMEAALADYYNFYRERHANRRLTWAHYLGTATLTARFPVGQKELSVSLYQATVLLLFNDRDTWSTEELEEQTMLRKDDLILTIHSLVLGRRQVLRRTTPRNGKSIKPDDEFSFNEEFTDTKVKIHINTIQQIETEEEAQQSAKMIDQYREASLDAAIVRIMKGAKTMKNQQLMTETIQAVAKHFKPEVKEIKKRIESLLDREFIERVGETDTFNYLA